MNDKKELDLLDIIAYTLNYVKKKKFLILGTFALALILSLIFHFTKEDEYESEMIVITNTADYTLVDQIATPLELGVRYNKIELTAALLKIDVDLARKINSIEVKEVEPHPAERVDGCTFAIKLKTFDRSLFGVISDPLCNFFNENEFITNITDVHLKSLQELHRETQEQIQRLDSIQKSIPAAMTQLKNEKSAMSDFNLGTMYNQMIDLKKVETETLEKIRLIQEFKVISDFKLIYATKGLLYFLLIGIAIGLVLNATLFIILTISYLIKGKNNS